MNESIDTCCAMMSAIMKHMNRVKKHGYDWKPSAMQARALSIVLERELKEFRKASVAEEYKER